MPKNAMQQPARKMLQKNMTEGEVLTTLSALEIGSSGVPIRFVATRPDSSKPLIFKGTAECHSMFGDGDVLIQLLNGGFGELPGDSPCLKQPFDYWPEPDPPWWEENEFREEY